MEAQTDKVGRTARLLLDRATADSLGPCKDLWFSRIGWLIELLLRFRLVPEKIRVCNASSDCNSVSTFVNLMLIFRYVDFKSSFSVSSAQAQLLSLNFLMPKASLLME